MEFQYDESHGSLVSRPILRTQAHKNDHCIFFSEKESCKEDEFRCEAEGTCIPQGWHCDGHQDCKDGLDETTCSKTLNNFDKEMYSY